VKANYRSSEMIECVTPRHQNIPEVQTITVSSPNRGFDMMHVDHLTTYASPPVRAVQIVTLSASNVVHKVQKIELSGSNLAQELIDNDYFKIKTTHSGSTTTTNNVKATASAMDVRQAVESLHGVGAVVHVTRQHADGKRGFAWLVTYVSLIGNTGPLLECEESISNYACTVSS